MGLLGRVELRFDLAPTNILSIAIIGLLSFFEFGYYRVFEAFIHLRPRAFFSDDYIRESIPEERREFWSQFMPGIGYITVTMLLFLYVVFAYH